MAESEPAGRLRAVSWAMSSSCGGVSAGIAVRASRNIVLQKGQAVPTILAPVATSSLARTWLTRSPVSSPRKARPPPAPQQKLRSCERGASTSVPACGDDGAGLVVDVLIAAEVAGVVVDDAFVRCCLREAVLVARHELGVVLDLGGDAELAPVGGDGADAVRADGDDLLDLGGLEGFRGRIRRGSGRRDRCRGGGPGRRCIFLFCRTPKVVPRCCMTRAKSAMISRPLGS